MHGQQTQLCCCTVRCVSCVLQFGNTALMIASNQGDFLKVKNLLEIQKADPNKQDKYGQTALRLLSSTAAHSD